MSKDDAAQERAIRAKVAELAQHLRVGIAAGYVLEDDMPLILTVIARCEAVIATKDAP